MMKFWITIIVLLLSFNSAFCQLKILEESKVCVTKAEGDVRQFISANHFDYALIGFYTSDDFSFKFTIYCLIKQRNKWYLAIINKTDVTNSVFTVKQQKLNKAKVDLFLQRLKPAQAFKYTQTDFNKLPQTCKYQKNGTEKTVYNIIDAATYNLMQLSNKEFKILDFYAPDSLLKNCYPYVKEYGILKGFVNTFNQLYLLTKDLPIE